MDIDPHTTDISDGQMIPIARMLDLDDVDSKLWRDDFLALGSRLRNLYDTQVTIDEDTCAYVVAMRGLEVRVTCTDEEPRAEVVRITCAVASLAEADTHLWQFALRENARLQLARLSFDRGTLWADYDLPFRVANGEPLQAGLSAVARLAESLGRELAVV